MTLDKNAPDYYSQISKMRKTNSGGKYFKNKEAAREAQKRSVEARRLRTAGKRTEEETEAKTA